MASTFQKLIYHFEQLPGIGPRQARRFAYALLRRSPSELREFGDLIGTIKSHIKQCPDCGLTHSESETTCTYCRDANRDPGTLLVVEKDADVEAIEKSQSYTGYYLILGGVVPIAGKNQVRENIVRQVVEKRREQGLQEIILGLSATTEGDQTRLYLYDLISPLITDDIKITTLGRGFATGTEVEYSDPETLKSALSNRTSQS